MPTDITLLDWIAIVWFALIWLAYNQVFGRGIGRLTAMNQQLDRVRKAWMLRMLERDNRIMDVNLVANSTNSVSLFASTTILIIAGIAGALGARDEVYGTLSDLGFASATSKQFFEVKLLLLLGIFIYSFFKFTWAIRQFNYLCALIGSAPLAGATAEKMEPFADTMGRVLSEAVKSFNAGLRAYYFAFASLAWFIHPVAYIIAMTLMFLILVRRQTLSPTARAVGSHGAYLE